MLRDGSFATASRGGSRHSTRVTSRQGSSSTARRARPAATIRRLVAANRASTGRPARIRAIPDRGLRRGMRVGFSADHAGAALKSELLRRIATERPEDELVDLGGDGSDPTDDYPDFAQRLGLAVRNGEVDRGILICGSGVGASVAANKIRGVRSAVCHDTYSAHQGVEHDDMNVLTLGARVIGPEPAVECSLAFLGASFSGEPRHRRRLDKVLAIEASETGAGAPR